MESRKSEIQEGKRKKEVSHIMAKGSPHEKKGRQAALEKLIKRTPERQFLRHKSHKARSLVTGVLDCLKHGADEP